jgi:hypothetical protein
VTTDMENCHYKIEFFWKKTFWWSCKYKYRSKKFTCLFGLVPMKFLLSDWYLRQLVSDPMSKSDHSVLAVTPLLPPSGFNWFVIPVFDITHLPEARDK